MVAADSSAKFLTVYGKLSSPDLMFVQKGLELVEFELGFKVGQIIQLTPTDYETLVDAKRKEYGDDVLLHRGNLIAFVGVTDPAYLGNLATIKSFLYDEYGYTSGKTNAVFYKRLATKNKLRYMQLSGHEFISITFNDHRPVIIELYNDALPKTCANFKELILAHLSEPAEDAKPVKGYNDTVVHRIVPEGWIQCGDVDEGKGTGSVAANGSVIPDESFAIKHLKHGIVGMANSTTHGNGSQFYITLSPLPWLDGKKVAFGRVFDGMRTLRMIEKEETQNQRPLQEISITECSLIDVPPLVKPAKKYDFPTAPGA